MVVKRLAGTFLFSNVFSEESSRNSEREREREREREYLVCPLESEIVIEVFLLKSECESD